MNLINLDIIVYLHIRLVLTELVGIEPTALADDIEDARKSFFLIRQVDEKAHE